MYINKQIVKYFSSKGNIEIPMHWVSFSHFWSKIDVL